MPTISILQYDNVDDFLSALDPAKPEWKKWYFRGQPDSSFKLIPSVWRDNNRIYFDNFCKKLLNQNKLKDYVLQKISKTSHTLEEEKVMNCHIYVRFENYLLSNFYSMANRAGLKLPEHQLRLSTTYPSAYWINGELNSWGGLNIDFFNTYKDGLGSRFSGPIIYDATLPQHYGLSTRILDWTSNPRKAAFFAAYNYLKAHDKKEVESIAVYGIKDGESQNGLNPIQIINAHSRYANKFLHVQDGLFTQIHGDFIYWEEGFWPSIDHLYEKGGSKYFELNKFVLNSNCVMDLLDRLNQCGISISEMMPDYKHIAEDIIIQSTKS